MHLANPHYLTYTLTAIAFLAIAWKERNYKKNNG
jgi:hypothetical protein